MAKQDQDNKPSRLINLCLATLPYPHLMSVREIEADAVRIEWRGVVYRITDTLSVEECERGMLVGSDRAILMRALFGSKDA